MGRRLVRIGISLPVREMGNDLTAIRDFAQAAEELGLTHLRVPDLVIRPDSGPLHEPLMMLSYIAAVTEKIELVPSVIVLPARPTVLVAKQMATLDHLSGGRVRMGVGVGGSEDSYTAQGQDFGTRGARCDEQLDLLKLLWTKEAVAFEGRWDTVSGAGLDPLPIQQPIPVWIGPAPDPAANVRRRIGQKADGWFVLATPEAFPAIQADIHREAEAVGRDPGLIGTEAGVAVVGPREAEWQDRVKGWHDIGLTHLCLRTLSGGLSVEDHIPRMRQAVADLPV